jgi:hypothetical protein
VRHGGGVLGDGGVEVLGQCRGQGRQERVFLGVARDRGSGKIGGRDRERDVEGRVEEVRWGCAFGFGFSFLGRRKALLLQVLLCWLGGLLRRRVVLLTWRVWRVLLSYIWRILI